MKTIQTKFNAVINEIITAFEKKHDLVLDYHIDNDVFFFKGGDYVFNLRDITYDLINDLPENMIKEWFDYGVKWTSIDPNHNINLKSWHKGCPRRTDEQLKKIEKLRQNIRDAEAVLKQQITELNENPY